jgi:DNA-binding CsgD family transcriptional regulator
MTARNKFFEHNAQHISYREAQVLLCRARGLTIAQAADFLSISPKTIQRHHDNIHCRFDLQGGDRQAEKTILQNTTMKKLKLTVNVLENRDASFGGANEIALTGCTCTCTCCKD